MRAARRVGGQQRSAHAYQAAHVEGAADLPLKITEAPGTAVQLDPRMGTWTCVFCGHGNSDKGLLVLGDAHARPPHGRLLHGCVGRCHAIMQLPASLHDLHELLRMLRCVLHGRGLGRRASLLQARQWLLPRFQHDRVY